MNSPFDVLLKPTGAICNLDCEYCFYLSKEDLYPDSNFRMSDDLLQKYLQQLFDSHVANEVNIVWQGGEPTLMGLPFFERMINLVETMRPRNVSIQHSIQTNGTLLTDEWCNFLKRNDFLVGLSIDGTAEMHDRYRVDKGGKPTHSRVIAAWQRLQAHQVEVNILCTVNSSNAESPLEVYRYFRDVLQARYLQFIPIVEQEGDSVSARTVKPKQWGEFLCSVFDEWVKTDIGKVFVQYFDVALGIWSGQPASLCIFAETCGNALALEHNGDLYSCDHFVDPEHLLGNINHRPITELALLPLQVNFGNAKRDSLPDKCRKCDVLFACRGECPKLRFSTRESSDPNLNYLCDGYYRFFTHIGPTMRTMAALLRAGRSAADFNHPLP